jgi:hypothetical protein
LLAHGFFLGADELADLGEGDDLVVHDCRDPIENLLRVSGAERERKAGNNGSKSGKKTVHERRKLAVLGQGAQP